MEFNKIAAAFLLTLLLALGIGKVGNTVVPHYYPPKDKEGAAATTAPPPEPAKPFDAKLIAAADPKEGERLVASQCTACHVWAKGAKSAKPGPNIFDIVGRKKAGDPQYDKYTAALRNLQGEWTYETLYAYLRDPAAMAPGTAMSFRVAADVRRYQIIAYLRTLSDSPKPLPQ